MPQKQNFRYDPLYRVIDETKEMQIVEGNFKFLFDRIKKINNLGVIPEVIEMAKYPKYEHELGTVHQINNLLEIADEEIIPPEYRTPLQLAALFLHLGHLPFTFSTERALLLACNLGDRSQENGIKKYVKKRLVKVLDKADFNDEKKENVVKDLFSLRDCKLLYKYFSGDIVIKKWRNLKDKFDSLGDESLKIIIKDLIDTENYGYAFLNLADKADFVQRDALYFGTVRLDVSPKHLYRHPTKYMPKFSISEEKLIESCLNYLTERFYDNSGVVVFSRLLEKIVASLITSTNFKERWLEDYNDEEFRWLLIEGLDKDNKRSGLPKTWISRAKDLFSGSFKFSNIFTLAEIAFQKEKDIIDVEYELTGKGVSERGLLTYPFDTGVLLAIDYSDVEGFQFDQNYRTFSIRLYQDDSKKNMLDLLKIIKNLSHYLSITHVENVREGLATGLSWTEKVDFNVDVTINAIVEAILNIESRNSYKKGDFVEKYLKNITSIATYDELWHSFENILVWKSQISLHLVRHRDSLKEDKVYHHFVDGLLSLPVRLLQFKTTKPYLDEIYNALFEIISNVDFEGNRGDFFEALCLIDKMRTKKGGFQLFLNRMVVIDPAKPRNEQQDTDYDIIELRVDGNDTKAECWIYECSIVDNYASKDRDKITKLSDNVASVFNDLTIYTKFLIPRNKAAGDWHPKEVSAGRDHTP
jgi:HD superfamily phosphohydrolase